MLTVKDTHEELSKGLDKLYSKPGKGKKDQEYLRHGAVALAMNKAFTQTGWDCVTERFDIIKAAYRCNSAAKEDPAGTYFTAIASAVVTVRARSLFRQDGTFTEVVRTCAGVGQAVGGKSTTEFDAIQNAITSAETAAFKRACRYFGPSTGLTLQFDPGEREAIENQLAQIDQLSKPEDERAASIEGKGNIEVSGDMSPPAQAPAPVAQTATPATPTPATPTPATPTPATPAQVQPAPSNGAADVPEVLRNLQDQTVLNRIASLASDDTVVSPEDVKALQITLAGSFERHGALGLWKTAGLPIGVGAVVKKNCLHSVAQVIEEASVGPGRLEGFLAKFKPQPKPAETAPAAAPASQGPTATVIMNGKHVAGPAPTVPAPGKTEVEPSAQGVAAPAREQTHGEHVQQMWNESDLAKAERRSRYTKRFGSIAPEVVTILAETPDEVEVDRAIGGKIHAVGLAIYQKLNQPSAAFELWTKLGYSFGNGQPKGKHLRAFADALPD